jgi:drug/metabolite transporter (DMT)-like permease
MIDTKYSDKTLSLVIFAGAAAWGMYWFPLRTIETYGISSAWTVVIFNACPLILLCPLLAIMSKQIKGDLWPLGFSAIMIGMAFTLYANALIETTVIRATLLFYLNIIWSTIMGIIWLSERFTMARFIAMCVALIGLLLLVSQSGKSDNPLNIGDLFGLLSGIFWAIGIAALGRWPRISIIPMTTSVYIATALLSSIFAIFVYQEPFPTLSAIKLALPTAAFWSVIILLPGFMIIFEVSKYLFPGRVGILMMSEVIVAIMSASILVPSEKMIFVQWLGAAAILSAGFIEVLFGDNRHQSRH